MITIDWSNYEVVRCPDGRWYAHRWIEETYSDYYDCGESLINDIVSGSVIWNLS